MFKIIESMIEGKMFDLQKILESALFMANILTITIKYKKDKET